MDTQNELELFREYATAQGWNTSPEQNNCGIVVFDRFKHPKVQLALDVWRDARTTLLSRIAELEESLKVEREFSGLANHKLAEAYDRIDALSKDAEWQSIDTAPRDENYYLFYRNGLIQSAKWLGDGTWGGDGWAYDFAENVARGNKSRLPTHWMPLPKPPAIDAAISSGE